MVQGGYYWASGGAEAELRLGKSRTSRFIELVEINAISLFFASAELFQPAEAPAASFARLPRRSSTRAGHWHLRPRPTKVYLHRSSWVLQKGFVSSDGSFIVNQGAQHTGAEVALLS